MITKYNIRKVLFFILLFADFTIAFLEKAKIFTITNKYWALSLPFIYLLPFLTLSGIPFILDLNDPKVKNLFNKDPNKGETLQNIDFGESIRPDFKACMYDGNIGFNSKEKKTKIVCCSFVLVVILMILALFFSVELKKETLAKFLFYISLTYFICFYIYFTLYSYSVLWFLYVKFFKWLGFAYFEKEFIKTIKKHNLFAISIFYYENQKRIRKIKIKSPTFIK